MEERRIDREQIVRAPDSAGMLVLLWESHKYFQTQQWSKQALATEKLLPLLQKTVYENHPWHVF